MNNAGFGTPLNILSSLIISNNGVLSIANSSVIVKGAGYPSDGVSVDGSLLINSGSLLFTNTFATRFAIGYHRNGFVNMTGEPGQTPFSRQPSWAASPGQPGFCASRAALPS